jgi:hypothetical protein
MSSACYVFLILHDSIALIIPGEQSKYEVPRSCLTSTTTYRFLSELPAGHVFLHCTSIASSSSSLKRLIVGLREWEGGEEIARKF